MLSVAHISCDKSTLYVLTSCAIKARCICSHFVRSKAAHRITAKHRQGLEEAKRLLPRQPSEDDAMAAHAALTAAVRTAEGAATERETAVAPPAGALLLAEAAAERPASAARDALVAHIEERCLSVEVEEWQGVATATSLVRQWLLLQVCWALMESGPALQA